MIIATFFAPVHRFRGGYPSTGLSPVGALRRRVGARARARGANETDGDKREGATDIGGGPAAHRTWQHKSDGQSANAGPHYFVWAPAGPHRTPPLQGRGFDPVCWLTGFRCSVRKSFGEYCATKKAGVCLLLLVPRVFEICFAFFEREKGARTTASKP